MADAERVAEALRALLAAVNDRDWERFEALMERHLDVSFALNFPRNDAPTIPLHRFLHRTRQATRLYPGLHEEVVATSGGEHLLWARVHRTWASATGLVEVDVHVVFEHHDSPTGARLGTAWEFLGPELPGAGQE